MDELFQEINHCRAEGQKQLLTVLEGAQIAEKAFCVDGNLIWESEPGGFFGSHPHTIPEKVKSGVLEIAATRVFCEVLSGENRLVICGGGHVSVQVVQLGIMLGFQVTVLEDRPKFADHARQAGATTVICDSFENGLQKIVGNENTYFVIVTRGHRYDQLCLERIIKKKHAYIGMIGSRRRIAMVKKLLLEKGYRAEDLDAVHMPIGLDIGAQTPAEIAVAIAGELIAVKNSRQQGNDYPPALQRALTGEDDQRRVLVTIVTRKGSAPQDIGTKMVIRGDGNCTGTIGGGCMESQVIQKALSMIRQGSPRAQICRLDMTADDAGEEGMVCGGVVEVLMEMVP